MTPWQAILAAIVIVATPTAHAQSVEYVSLAVPADSPLKSAKEEIERLRKEPGGIAVAVGTGVGSATQTAFAHAMFMACVEATGSSSTTI